MRIYKNYSLKNFNTFGIDAHAQQFVEYKSCHDLLSLVGKIHTPCLVIGRGSNILFKSDFPGIVLHCSNQEIHINYDESGSGYRLVEVGAGKVWDDFVAWAVYNGLSGVENLSLIPGEVGAAAVQNIGAYGCEAKDVIEWVEYVRLSTGEVIRQQASELHYSYRQSIFKQDLKDDCALLKVCFRLSTVFSPRLEYGALQSKLNSLGVHEGSSELTPAFIRNIIIEIRNSKLPDPKKLGNAGSFFMNPIVSHSEFERLHSLYPDIPFYEQEGGVKIPAGWLIEQCGWKGRTMGNVGVYDRQALVLVNHGGASGSDIVALSESIRSDVKSKFGIDIFPEVKFV
ncbi:MAG: UDP-N-acetylmuramate dehydrogenase [Prevotellaceae bacterium]|nr:UDP-N-acetylmuramate dehydrogenase [Candidatus Colivivens equi]